MSSQQPVRRGQPSTHEAVFARASRRVAVLGAFLVAASLVAGAVAGGTAWTGVLWGAGAGALMTAVSAVTLGLPWQRFPLLASSGVALSFAGKVAVLVGVVVLLGPRRETTAPGWFFLSLAVVLVGVTVAEVGTLAAGRALTVEPQRDCAHEDDPPQVC